MTRQVRITPELVSEQRRASDPGGSVWVSANAGSGKTYVLTERVLRLMLGGVPPEQILCLTYTKAAAAEMRGRVSERLGAWAVLDEDALRARLSQLQGRVPDGATMLRARSLFAHALETPGGLKILTIHAFCESVLHRFPKEAGVPFDFTVVEDFERERMVAAARESVIAAGLRGDGAAAAVETLFGLLSDHEISEAIGEALAQQRRLKPVVADAAGSKRRLRVAMGVGQTQSRAGILAEMSEGYGLDATDHAAIFALVPPDPAGMGFVDRLARIDPAAPDPMALCEAYLTKERTARKAPLRKADANALPVIAERLATEGARLEALWQDLNAADLIARSDALLDVLAAIAAHYEGEKRARSLLDFDDLIAALARLLEDEAQGPWVRYKLDSGITHVLVDEGQDTNPEQWRVVDRLVEEFFEHEKGGDRPKTLFAVGDPKQSIFSFQGADPDLFINQGRRYGLAAKHADVLFDPVDAKTSFRTLPRVLEAVDLTFRREDLREGVLSDQPVIHFTARIEGGGSVTLWPPLKQEAEETDPRNWPLRPPKSVQSAARQVAERVAAEIDRWIEERRPLGPRGRAVEANDVLILVQTRGLMFQEIIRALIRRGLPTPGADRLAVTSHIGVLDLMALGDVLLNPNDDLQLAALLRSPLFGVGEDDLYALAQPRGDGERLWTALAASKIASAAGAYEQLARWRGRLDFERPFELFAEVLYAEDGLRRLHARLGPEIDDVMSEFLDLALQHEQSSQPSLQGFLAALRGRDVSIKRELAESGGGVRVMTVHGAKGLQAPIVILADAAATGKGRTGRSVYLVDGAPGPLLVHAPSERLHIAQSHRLKEFADAAQAAEYWRKLYVAMTRAEDELYVTGALTQTGKLEGSWYEAIDTALRPEAEVVEADGAETALIFPRARPIVAAAKERVAAAPPAAPAALQPLPAYTLRRMIRPSSAFGDADPQTVLQTSAERLADRRDPEAAREEGTALHALLQHLTRLPLEHWDAVLDKALPVLLPEYPGAHGRIAAKARSILRRPELSQLFGPDSRAEVPILAQGTRNGVPVTIAGRIDRMVVTPEKVTLVDYKSDAAAPAIEGAVPPAYLTQLALYALCASQLFKGREVAAQILWTGPESLMILGPARLREAVAGFTIG